MWLYRYIGKNKKEQKIHIVNRINGGVFPAAKRMYKDSLCGLERMPRAYMLYQNEFDDNILYTDLCLDCVTRLLHDETHNWRKKLNKYYSINTLNTIATVKEYNKQSADLKRRLDLAIHRLAKETQGHSSFDVRWVMIQNLLNSFKFFDDAHTYKVLDLAIRVLLRGGIKKR